MTTPHAPTAASLGLATCHTCGKVSPAHHGDPEKHSRCPRCSTTLHLRKPHSLQRTWALLISAAFLYVPANFLPIMEVHGIRGDQKSTILSGVITFWQMKAYPVATIIFTASVLIPLLKVAALVWLCMAAQGRARPQPLALSRVYHITELLGRWSMVDVFVVAVLVCLVRLGSLMTITPGPAAVSFCGVVILTMFAAMSFDPRLIWDRHREAGENPNLLPPDGTTGYFTAHPTPAGAGNPALLTGEAAPASTGIPAA